VDQWDFSLNEGKNPTELKIIEKLKILKINKKRKYQKSLISNFDQLPNL
jgi:hypothetical protein